MPVAEVHSGPVPVHRFDVIGSLNARTRCVEHVGLSLEDRNLIAGPQSPLRIVDMAPPISERMADDRFLRHLVGTADLTPEVDIGVLELLENFVAETSGPIEPQSLTSDFPLSEEHINFFVFTIHPHMVSGSGDEDDEVRPTRYSCAGYVHEGYRRAKLPLLDVESLPELTFEQISRADPRLRAARISEPELLAWTGINGEGSWPVMMPGYLIASLNRSGDDIRRTPYQPRPADITFPPSAPANEAAPDPLPGSPSA